MNQTIQNDLRLRFEPEDYSGLEGTVVEGMGCLVAVNEDGDDGMTIAQFCDLDPEERDRWAKAIATALNHFDKAVGLLGKANETIRQCVPNEATVPHWGICRQIDDLLQAIKDKKK